MQIQTHKSKETKAGSTPSSNAGSVQFKDQRPESKRVAQLKQVAGAQEKPITQLKPNNTGLPNNLKSGIENLSGHSMDDVKVHYNSARPAQLQAHAYAQGNQIHLGPGQEKHLPHEAWHVVQQKQGRVKPTVQMKGSVSVNEDAGLEKEADVMGAKALKQDPIKKPKTKTLSEVNLTAQLFAIPLGLNLLENKVNEVKNDLGGGSMPGKHDTGEQLYGSDDWAKDTFWAANRKLDEWNLVKELVKDGSTITDAVHIGFGINDTTQADGLSFDNHNNILSAGENKIVSGGFPQVVDNVNSALSQLTAGNRAKKYHNTKLLARIRIDNSSAAFGHLKDMREDNQSAYKGQLTRWKNKLKNAYQEGESNWNDGNGNGNCGLRLIIESQGETLFDETL